MEKDKFENIYRDIQKDFADMAKAYSRFMMRTNANLQELRDLIDEINGQDDAD